MDGGEFAQEGEVATAVWAGVRWQFGKFWFWVGVGTEVEANRLPRFDGGTTHEAVVTDSGEAFGQDVKKPTTDKFENCEGEDAGFLGLAAGPVELDVALFVVADDAFGADGTAADVASQIAEGGFALADVLELDVPGFFWMKDGFGLGREVFIDVGVVGLEGFAQEGAKAGGEWAEVD